VQEGLEGGSGGKEGKGGGKRARIVGGGERGLPKRVGARKKEERLGEGKQGSSGKPAGKKMTQTRQAEKKVHRQRGGLVGKKKKTGSRRFNSEIDGRGRHGENGRNGDNWIKTTPQTFGVDVYAREGASWRRGGGRTGGEVQKTEAQECMGHGKDMSRAWGEKIEKKGKKGVGGKKRSCSKR